MHAANGRNGNSSSLQVEGLGQRQRKYDNESFQWKKRVPRKEKESGQKGGGRGKRGAKSNGGSSGRRGWAAVKKVKCQTAVGTSGQIKGPNVQKDGKSGISKHVIDHGRLPAFHHRGPPLG